MDFYNDQSIQVGIPVGNFITCNPNGVYFIHDGFGRIVATLDTDGAWGVYAVDEADDSSESDVPVEAFEDMLEGCA